MKPYAPEDYIEVDMPHLHPGLHIRHAVEAKDINNESFCKATGISITEIFKVYNGEEIPSEEFLNKLSKLFKPETIEFFRKKGQAFTRQQSMRP